MTLLTILSLVFLLSSIATGVLTSNTWKNVGISWSLLVTGAIMFGIALTL
jgi:hypothetical protein